MRAIDERLMRFGSIGFDDFVELALYDPDDGFFAAGRGGAGRAGSDFITSPEVGPLFGAVVARYLDDRWSELGEPDPFVVVEAAAGRGALAISVLAAEPRCGSALRYVLVERSEALRSRQHEHLALVEPFEVLGPEPDPDSWVDVPSARGTGPLVCSLADLPVGPFLGVVLANELLDNIPFRLAEYDETEERWMEVRVQPSGRSPAGADSAREGDLVEAFVPIEGAAETVLRRLVTNPLDGSRAPVQEGAGIWLRDALSTLQRGTVAVIDYADTTESLARRPSGERLRTYRSHQRGGVPLDAPGTQDVTCEVATDQLELIAEPARRARQAEWLRIHGIDELVDAGRRLWKESAHAPGLAAMRGRSRVTEADALLDGDGLGAFVVLEWDVDRD